MPDRTRHAAGGEISLSRHAALEISERGIDPEWVRLTLDSPNELEDDPTDGELTRYFRQIPQFGDRWLRVVAKSTDGGTRVITCFFDRNRGRRP